MSGLKYLIESLSPDAETLPEPSSLWPQIISLATTEPSSFNEIVPLISLYSESVPEFSTGPQEQISKDVEEFSSCISLEQQNKKAIPLFCLLVFMNEDNLRKTLTTAIRIIHNHLQTNNTIPTKFFDIMDYTNIDASFIKQSQKIYEICKAAIGGEMKAGAMITLASFIPQIVQIHAYEFEDDQSQTKVDEYINFVVQTVTDAFNSDDNKLIIAGANLLAQIAGFFENEPDYSPDPITLFNLLLPKLKHSDISVKKWTTRAFQELVYGRVFLNESILGNFLNQFSTFNDDNILYFYKILEVFIDPNDADDDEEEEQNEDDLTIIQPIVDHVLEKIDADISLYTKGQILRTIAELAFKDEVYVEDVMEKAVSVAASLVSQKAYLTYRFVALFACTVSKQFEDFTPEIIKFLPDLTNSLIQCNECKPLKHQLTGIGFVAQIISKGLCDDLVKPITDFVLTAITSDVQAVIENACGVIVQMKAKFDKESANQIFQILVNHNMQTDDNELVSMLTHVLKKMIKKYPIEPLNADSFTAKILAGDLAILHGNTLNNLASPNQLLFDYLCTYITKYPSKAKPICNQCIEWIDGATFDALGGFFSILKSGITVGALDKEQMNQISHVLIDAIEKSEDDTDLFKTIIEVLSAIHDTDASAIHDLKTFITKIEEYSSSINLGEEEEEDIDTEKIETMPSVMKFVLQVYEANEELEVNYELLQKLVDLLPFPPQVPEMNDIMCTLAQLCQNPERFEPILVNSLINFAEILLLKKSELDEYEFAEETIAEMKQALKKNVKGNKAMEKKVTREFAKSRAKLNRFLALIR